MKINLRKLKVDDFLLSYLNVDESEEINDKRSLLNKFLTEENYMEVYFPKDDGCRGGLKSFAARMYADPSLYRDLEQNLKDIT